MRLKHVPGSGILVRRSPMNYKNLNYEIETVSRVRGKGGRPLTMNYKNLNYEIETTSKECLLHNRSLPMNYKNLNYEIETSRWARYGVVAKDYEL